MLSEVAPLAPALVRVLLLLLQGFGPLAVALGYYLTHVTIDGWLRSFTQALANKSRSPFGYVATAPVRLVTRGIAWVFHQTKKVLGDAVAVSITPLVHFLTGLGTAIELRTKQAVGMAEDMTRALSWLRHHSIPALIHRIVAPVHALARLAAHEAQVADRFAHAAERRLLHGIDRLRRDLTHELRVAFHGIDAFVRHTVWPRVRAAERDIAGVITRDLPAIRRRERALAHRVGRLEKLLAAGVITGLVVRTLAKRFPWLFCRTWRKIGPRVCSMHTGLLDWLLGIGAAMFAFHELCALVDSLAGIAARVVPQMVAPLAQAGAALCDGAHSAAPPLPLTTTALPTVANPLTID